MQNLSRTALKELKKRYLNVLKKCFLLNMMMLGVITLSTIAKAETTETSEPTLTPSEELETVVYDSSNFSRTTISSDTTIDLAGKNLTYTGKQSSSSGGVFYVNSGKILEFINSDETTDPLLLFKDNTASSNGGAIFNWGDITFGGNTTFSENTATKYGGAIENYRGDITFAANASFMGNTASSNGGAIYNDGTITFGGDATFTGNSITGSSYAYGGAIYNEGDITFGENSILFFENNKANDELNDIYNEWGTINILGTVASNIHLISSGGTIGLKAKDTDGDGKVTYTGSYDLSSITLDISGDGAKEISIEKLTVNGSTLKWDAELKDTENGYLIVHDTIKDAQGSFTSGSVSLMSQNKDKWYKVSVADLYNQPLIKEGGSIDYGIGGFYRMKDIIYGENGTDVTGFSINIVNQIILGTILRENGPSTIDLSQYNLTVNEDEPITYMITAKDLSNGSMGELGSGEKTIIGATERSEDTVINANGVGSLFNLGTGDVLNISNLTIASAHASSNGGAIYNKGSITLNSVDFTNNSSSSGGAIYNVGSNATSMFVELNQFC